jgi:hypothetical protein
MQKEEAQRRMQAFREELKQLEAEDILCLSEEDWNRIDIYHRTRGRVGPAIRHRHRHRHRRQRHRKAAVLGDAHRLPARGVGHLGDPVLLFPSLQGIARHADDNYDRPEETPWPRYEVEVRWGRRYEPWVTEVKLIGEESTR